MLYVHPDECIGCGACVPECLVEAMFAEAEVPEKWKSWILANYEKAPQSTQIAWRKDPLAGKSAKVFTRT